MLKKQEKIGDRMKKTFVNWAVIAIFVIGYPMKDIIFRLLPTKTRE